MRTYEDPVNVENVDKLIKYMKRLKADKFIMQDWITGDNGSSTTTNGCGTTACIAGWCKIMNKSDDSPLSHAERFLGGTPYYTLMMYDENGYSLTLDGGRFQTWDFDKLPAKDRKALMIKALEYFRDTGETGWQKIMRGYFDGKVKERILRTL